MDENHQVVEDAASPVQVEVGLDVLGDLGQAGVVLKRAPVPGGKLFTSRLFALHLLLSDRFADMDVRLGTGEKNGKEEDVQVQILHPQVFSLGAGSRSCLIFL